tara:strand:- start:1095 stop:1286 length:192 start_codon:yes stop_codon:yes gene_type:complete
MKITCDRRLGDEEKEMLVAEAKNMDALSNKLEINKQWVGDGMLYRTTVKDVYHFVDQKYEEEA